MSWARKIGRWRALEPMRQARIRRARLVLNVAESMAFAGQPADVTMLATELQRLVGQQGTSTRGSGR